MSAQNEKFFVAFGFNLNEWMRQLYRVRSEDVSNSQQEEIITDAILVKRIVVC